MDWTWAEHGIRTELRGEPWGELRAVPVTVCVSATSSSGEDPTADLMSAEQRKTFELLRDFAPDLYPLIIEGLQERFGGGDGPMADPYEESYEDDSYDAYEDQLYGGYDDQPGDGAPISDLFDSYEDRGEEVAHEEESFEEQFGIQALYILEADEDQTAAPWALIGHAEFEPERGIGVIFDYNVVDEVGYQESVLAELR